MKTSCLMILAAKSQFAENKTGSVGALFCLITMLSAVSGCSDSGSVPLYLSGPTMGTSYNITIVDEAYTEQATEIAEAVTSILNGVNQTASTYIDNSELVELNRDTIEQVVRVSDDLFSMLLISEQVYRLTEGGFDVTVGPVVDLWGFGPGYNQQVPSDSDIEAAQALTGFSKLVLNDASKSVSKTSPVQIDLSSVAKGYAVDLVADYFLSMGIANFLVEIGGEIRVNGHNPKGNPWRIGIESPNSSQASPAQAVAVTDLAMATSGDYRNYFDANGVRYSHTIDPRTGRPITHNLASVTVFADTSALADALATGLNVVGFDRALTICEQQKLACFFILHDGENFVQQHSSEFTQYLD